MPCAQSRAVTVTGESGSTMRQGEGPKRPSTVHKIEVVGVGAYTCTAQLSHSLSLSHVVHRRCRSLLPGLAGSRKSGF